MKTLVNKKFKVYVCGEYERQTNFLGLLKLLHNFSDFFEYTPKQQKREIKDWLKDKCIYVDSSICCKIRGLK